MSEAEQERKLRKKTATSAPSYRVESRKGSTTTIYIAAGSMFGSMAARGFLLPLYATDLGLDRAQVGLLFSAYSLAAAAFALPAGIVVDRLGTAYVLWFSVVATTLSQVALSWTTHFEILFAWQLLGGLGSSASMATLMVALADSVPESRLGRSIGWLTFSNQVGYLTGPALAAVALHWISLRTNLVGSALLCLMILPLSLFIGLRRSGLKRDGDTRRHLSSLARLPAFHSLVLALFAATLLWGTLEAYLPLLGRQNLGLTDIQIGLMLAAQALVNGGARLPSGRLVDRLKYRSALIAGCSVAYAVCVAGVPHLTGWLGSLVVIVSVAFIAMTFVALAASFAELATPENKGTTMGAYVAVLNLGLAIGPAIFGPAMEKWGFETGFALCGLAASALAITAAILRRSRHSQTNLSDSDGT